MVEYTVAMCNYNMAGTLERSLTSILDQVTDDYEVLVVDGGSTDGSLDILEALREEDSRLRYVALDPDPTRRLGADRQRSIEEARGTYVLPQLDVDDVYEPVVTDFVDLYHQLESGVDSEFFLSGTGLNMAPRELLLEVPYRNLASSEDRDLWRRLFARDAIIWLDHEAPMEEIGYGKSLTDELRRDLSGKVADAQVGIGLASSLAWSLRPGDEPVLRRRRGPFAEAIKRAYDIVTYPLAHAFAMGRERYETPAPYDRKGALAAAIADRKATVAELEERHGVDVDRDRLSETGRELLCID